MAPLKLAKLPDRETTKITFMANAELVALLNEYAAAYQKEYGRKEAVTDLIPPMLETFVRSDRGFKASRLERTATASGNRREPELDLKNADGKR